jgi:hypothetical protein
VPVEQTHDLPLVEDLYVLIPRLFGKQAQNTPFFAHVGYDNTDKIVISFAGEEEES